MTTAYIVITDTGVSLATMDPARAHEFARTVEAVVVEVPVIADYRQPTED